MVTGASRGIGAETAKKLAAGGAEWIGVIMLVIGMRLLK
ncbi:hypothetical protein [Paenibacillus timonensis]